MSYHGWCEYNCGATDCHKPERPTPLTTQEKEAEKEFYTAVHEIHKNYLIEQIPKALLVISIIALIVWIL